MKTAISCVRASQMADGFSHIYTHLSSQKKDLAIHALQQHFSDTLPKAL